MYLPYVVGWEGLKEFPRKLPEPTCNNCENLDPLENKCKIRNVIVKAYFIACKYFDVKMNQAKITAGSQLIPNIS
jgi:hypothetical protein